ncbi:phosphoribosylaminoimidazole-succinocarboxamide synthase [Trichoderma cornu-damae]|uniref:Phosphoribosylaminoimidazole-succinocarboxamide synthase n=1 Tax=Trichoderma cornu-damae TaxID=654480 RepID=A0A9P8QKW0_9HYPO|nr:phosphoribosylaminoimidazole-succinocarboxamide synthase [Trichoderma cornu-damae]
MSYQGIDRDHAEPSRWRPSNTARYRPVPESEASSPPSTRHKRQQSSRSKRSSQPARHSARPPNSQADNDASDAVVAPLRIIKSRSSDLRDTDRSSARPPPIQPEGYHAIEPEEDPIVHFDEAQLAMFAADNASRMPNIKDELALAAGKVTPGVDDTPYIQYALQALVSGPNTSLPSHLASGSSEGYSERYGSARGFDESAGYSSPSHQDRVAAEDARPDSPPQGPPSPIQPPRRSTASFDPTGASTSRWAPVSKTMQRDVDPHGRTHSPLTFKPRILRAFSMAILAILILLMMAALIFSARYSYEHSGLTPYPGSIYSGQYFLFRILPQLLAGIIFIYAQSVAAASLRVLPFAAMASEDPRARYMALFQRLYPASFLLPQFVGPWQFKIFDVATWLSIFTIPLQSSAFTCIFVHEKWVWAPVQPVVWALVGLYGILLVATVVLMVHWLVQWTGLAWDIRSIGDLLPLLNRSNAMASYRRNDLSENAKVFKSQLRERWFDRLGYWKDDDGNTGGIWYAIGTSPDQDSWFATGAMGKKVSNDLSADLKGPAPYSPIETARGRYLPLCLRTGPLVASVAVTFVLLAALVVVSFLPQTRLESGFLPMLSAKPDRNAFSPADFVFSFVPALIGMILFLQFQAIDQSLRLLQPWADLYDVNGSLAQRSLLADYAACLPLQSTWRALGNGHWRVAAVSLLATLFIFIPILGGGLLMALTGPDRTVRMYPSMPVFGVLLAFLFLYVAGLSLAVPHRRQFLLPRPVTSIAGIISLCSAEELTQDAAFRSVRGRKDLEYRLGVGRDDSRGESSWFFGIVPGRDDHRLSIRRMNNFTEKLPASSRSMA